MIKKTPPDNIWGVLSWSLDCIATGLSKSTGKPEPECEMDYLASLVKRAEAIEKIPKSEYKIIGDILFKSFDKTPPCSALTDPDSIRAELPEEIRLKFRLKKKMNQAEHLVFVDAIFKASIIKAWLRRDPVKVGEHFINMERFKMKATHGALVEARTNVLWEKRIKASDTNRRNVRAKHDKNKQKKMSSYKFGQAENMQAVSYVQKKNITTWEYPFQPPKNG